MAKKEEKPTTKISKDEPLQCIMVEVKRAGGIAQIYYLSNGRIVTNWRRV